MNKNPKEFKEFKGMTYNIRYVPRSDELAYKNGSIAPTMNSKSKRHVLNKTIISFIKPGK